MPPESHSSPPPCTIDSLGQYVGELVTLRGWVSYLRSSGKVRFIVLRDGTGLAQGVLVKGRRSLKKLPIPVLAMIVNKRMPNA